MLWLRAGAKQGERRGGGGCKGGGGFTGKRERETKREMELEKELRMCRARLASHDEMMMGVVKVKQETKDAKSAAQAQLKDAQQALVHATATRRSELQALHAQMTQVSFFKSLSHIVRDLIQKIYRVLNPHNFLAAR
jgi:phenylalanyl-tRNA synthetase alpha subunit